ncbi:MAG: Flp family type IVb pilin [Mesorhizobium sp.]|nr:Flp family type IVb pilin [Mesorhizobium sp.]MBN9244969.1 Flp family type IVb pilin [Mesorhizobium sp.]MBN9269516.1 Flp family type IVb pilin [Mesorhizobium sp.]
MTTLRSFMDGEEGATAIEYGLLASLVSLAMIVGFGLFADSLRWLWSEKSSEIVQVLE